MHSLYLSHLVEIADRPLFEIDPEQRFFLRELNFTWQTIATMLGISRPCVTNMWQLACQKMQG